MWNDGKVKKKGITRRWVYVSLVSTLLILLIASVAIMLVLRSSYQQAARQALTAKARSLASSVAASSTLAEARAAAAVGLVENFDERDKYELMLVGRNGRVVATSSGFAYSQEESLDDYYEASRNDDGHGSFIGYSINGEHIIAVTQIISGQAGDVGAIRLVSSLGGIDEQLYKTVNMIVLVDIAVLLFTAFSGGYFVRSIVLPLKEVGKTAGTIAKGDYSARIDNKYGDEIGDLCDTINDMAAGLSELDKTKNEFISSVSHELRTPLTSIKGWAETLAAIGQSDEENYRKGIGIIISETERLSYMVEDLLDFSRLQTGKMRISPERIDISDVVQDAIATVEQRALRAGIAFEYDAPGAVLVMADRNRAKQVFGNIFDNAVKYSNPGDTITVTLSVRDGFAFVATKDMGSGIPENELPNITERFFKASNSVTGSGIGLAVVKEIVGLHGGELNIESALGKGTTVTASFPLDR